MPARFRTPSVARSATRRSVTVGAALIVLALVGACAGAPATAPMASIDPTATPVGSPATATADPTSTSTPQATAGIDGRFEAAGHRLRLLCEGDGSPTVVYIHGMSPEPPDSGIEHGAPIAPFLSDSLRFCRYDRANVGDSDRTKGKRTAIDAVRDLRALLHAAAVPGPYVLLGASFGGLIAYEYAITFPADVVGMVVLDPTLPREYLDIDPYYHPVDGPLTGEEWRDNLEQMDWLGSMQETQGLEGSEPPIPLIYLALVHPETWWDPVTPESIAAYRAMQQRFTDLWSPGSLVLVDTPHYMEPVIPERIAQAVRDVIALIRD